MLNGCKDALDRKKEAEVSQSDIRRSEPERARGVKVNIHKYG